MGVLSWAQRVLSRVQRVLSWAQRVLSWAQRVLSWTQRVLSCAHGHFLPKPYAASGVVVAIQLVNSFCYARTVLRMTARHPCSHPGAQPSQYGFPVANKDHRKNGISDAGRFEATLNPPVPVWWPRFANGEIVKHVYRLLDEKKGSDLSFPGPLDMAICHKVQHNKPVNFHDPDIKKQALRHVDKISDGRTCDRPFLSTSYSLDAVVSFASRKTSKGHGSWNAFVRIDLLALWDAKLFTATSFAQLRSPIPFIFPNS